MAICSSLVKYYSVVAHTVAACSQTSLNLEHCDAFYYIVNCLMIAYEWRQRVREPQESNVSLWASCYSQYSVHQGRSIGCCGGEMWLVRVRLFHFVMWFLFSFMDRFFTGGLVPFTWIYYFSHWGSWWIRISVSDFVCASVRINACAGVCVQACEARFALSLCVREPRFHGCFRSLCLTVRQSEGARRETEMER